MGVTFEMIWCICVKYQYCKCTIENLLGTPPQGGMLEVIYRRVLTYYLPTALQNYTCITCAHKYYIPSSITHIELGWAKNIALILFDHD